MWLMIFEKNEFILMRALKIKILNNFNTIILLTQNDLGLWIMNLYDIEFLLTRNILKPKHFLDSTFYLNKNILLAAPCLWIVTKLPDPNLQKRFLLPSFPFEVPMGFSLTKQRLVTKFEIVWYPHYLAMI